METIVNSYIRSDDGVEMIEVAPDCYVNRKAAERLGLIARRRREELTEEYQTA